jgi:hypothetical protein
LNRRLKENIYYNRLICQQKSFLNRTGKKETNMADCSLMNACKGGHLFLGTPRALKNMMADIDVRISTDMNKIFSKIISGGQTGVDRAALDVALELGIPCGGWCPKGRKAEDGPISLKYPLKETNSPNYPLRTEKNVREADGTLILTRGPVQGGTALTVQFAVEYEKPHLIIDLDDKIDPLMVREWGEKNKVKTLNVAGPRESEAPGIFDRAVQVIKSVIGESGEGPIRKLKIRFG